MWLTSVSLTLFAFIACASAYSGGWGYYPPNYQTPPPSNTPPPSPPGTTTSPQCGPPGGCTCDCTCPPRGSGGGNPCIPCPTPGNGNGTYPNNFTLTNDCIYNIRQACNGTVFKAGDLIALVLKIVLRNLVSPTLQILLVGNNTLEGAVIPLASLLCTILGIILCLLKNLGLLGLFGIGGLLGQLFIANGGSSGLLVGILGGLGGLGG